MAEPATPVRAPSIPGATRAAAEDLYFNSWRVVPWNVAWGAGLIATLVVWASAGSLMAVPIAALLVGPTAALSRLGGRAVRGLGVHLSDGLHPVRRRPAAVLGGGLVTTVLMLVFVANVSSGLAIGGPIGWSLATLAAWGLVATAVGSIAVWPLLTDPDRDGWRTIDIVRLAGLLVLAHPVPLGALTAVVLLLLAVGTLLFAVLVTVAVGFVMLLACRVVLPAADRLETRLAARDPLPTPSAHPPPER